MKRIAGEEASCGEKPPVHNHKPLRNRIHREGDDHRQGWNASQPVDGQADAAGESPSSPTVPSP
jgi:hypothetical protein